jgi:plasmid stability protein
MTQLIIDHLDQTTIAKLADLAATNRLSVEEQAKRILTDAVGTVDRRRLRLETADRVAAMTPKKIKQTDSALLLREDRDR